MIYSDGSKSVASSLGIKTIDSDHVVWELAHMAPEDFDRAVRSGKVALIARLFRIKGSEIIKRVRLLQSEHQE
jgi:hypothetical protein